jgi:hypothetical protein
LYQPLWLGLAREFVSSGPAFAGLALWLARSFAHASEAPRKSQAPKPSNNHENYAILNTRVPRLFRIKV